MDLLGQRLLLAAAMTIVSVMPFTLGAGHPASAAPSSGQRADGASTDPPSEYQRAAEPKNDREKAARVAAEAVRSGELGFYMESAEKNTVYVGLEPTKNSSDEQERVSAELAAAAEVKPEQFTFITYLGSTDDSAIWGGDGFSGCSGGAWGYAWYGSLQVPLQVTAGHCPESLRHTTGGSHGPDYITRSQWDAGSVDAQSMSPNGVFGQSTTRVRGTGRIISVGPAGAPFDRAGDTVCKSGVTTGYTCGAIWTTNGGCAGHTGMRLAGYNRAGGDSGGAVVSATFPDVGLVGIHSGSCEIDLGGGPFRLARYGFQANAAYILGLAGWYTS